MVSFESLPKLYAYYRSLNPILNSFEGGPSSICVGSDVFLNDEIGVAQKAQAMEALLWERRQREENMMVEKNEIDLFLLEKCEPINNKFDLLGWWRNSCTKFPILSWIARDVFAMQVSTVASESAFSTSGRILDPFRSSLTPKMVEGLICTHNWLQASHPIAQPLPLVSQVHASECEDYCVQNEEYYDKVISGKLLIFIIN